MTHREDMPPAWILGDCEPMHVKRMGPRVMLRIAVGLAPAMLTPDHAEALGKELIETAERARVMPPV